MLRCFTLLHCSKRAGALLSDGYETAQRRRDAVTGRDIVSTEHRGAGQFSPETLSLEKKADGPLFQESRGIGDQIGQGRQRPCTDRFDRLADLLDDSLDSG